MENEPNKIYIKKKTLFLIFIIFIAIVLMISYILFYQQRYDVNVIKRKITNQFTKSAHTVIAKAGKENIYKEDLDYEIKNYPPVKDIDLNKFLLDKIILDSKILQAGEELGLIKLNKNIFNSANKNYLERIDTVEFVKRQINNQADSIKGTVISIWFYNNDEVGALGYDAGRNIALTKITQLQTAVKNNTMTIEQAADSIRNDNNLVYADPQYAANASFEFSVNKGERITFDKKLDDELWSLPEGVVSKIHTGTSSDDKDAKDAVFHFGIVKKRISSGKFNSLDSWLASLKDKYEIIYY